MEEAMAARVSQWEVSWRYGGEYSLPRDESDH